MITTTRSIRRAHRAAWAGAVLAAGALPLGAQSASPPMPSSPMRPAVAALRLAIDSNCAPVDELFVNDGIARLTFTGGRRAGAPAMIRARPAAGDVPVSNRVHTSRGGERADAPRARCTANRYDITGTVASGDTAAVGVAIRAPGRAWLVTLATAFRARGLRVDGGVASDTMPVRAPLDTLVRWESPTLAEVLPHFEKSSQNQVGELLLRALGRVADTVGTPEAGRRVAVAHLAAWGIDSTMAAARDGSGLSRHDYVAPEAIVRLLDAVRLLPDGGAFRESLPVAGGGGTLARRMRGSPAQGNVRAKTGFVDKARSLSGYVSTADGATLLFSTLCDSWTTPMGAVERVQDAIVIQLASLTLVAPDAQRC